MEFFVCPCPGKGTVILDGKSQGLNKDDSGNLLPKQCNKGLHTISLECLDGKTCTPPEINIVIQKTNPISPKAVAFQCA